MEFQTKLTPVKIGLPDMLDALWDELVKASARGQQRGDARFVFEEAEVEVAIAIEAKADAKFSLHVVEFGSGLTGTRTATLRIKIKQFTADIARDHPDRWVFLADKTLVPDSPLPSSPEQAEAMVRARSKKKKE